MEEDSDGQSVLSERQQRDNVTSPSVTPFGLIARERLFKSPFTSRRPVTPHSRRLVCSIRRTQELDTEPEYEGLLRKQWKTYALSPLFKLKGHRAALAKYERSLDAAYAQARSSSVDPLSSGTERSHFSFYKDLKFVHGDPPALRVQVIETEDSGKGPRVVLEVLLVCVELLSELPVPANVRSNFTYYPVALVSGNKTRTNLFFLWLERHFDCRSEALTFSDTDLRHFLAVCTAFISGSKSLPVLLQYSVEHICEGMDVINCNLEAGYCKALWDRLFSSSDEKEELNQDEVDTFVDHIEDFVEHLMSIHFKKLPLSEIGTPTVYVSRLGKLKMFTPSVVYAVLHLLCEIANGKFLKMVPRRPQSSADSTATDS